jgi:SPP1 family predicted phage head-tail adaptor
LFIFKPISQAQIVVTEMASNFKPSDFSRTVELGNPQSHRTGAGLNISTFVPAYSLHFKTQKRTLTQQYTLVGTRLDNSITIITRHDGRNAVQQQARIGGIVYDISDVSPDDSNNAIRYDYLTLVKITKGA